MENKANEIKKFIHTLVGDGLIHIWMKGKKEIIAGVFDDIDKAVQATMKHMGNHNCYITMNRIDDTKVTVSNTLQPIKKAISDRDISHISYLLVDIDVNKHGFSCANSEETKKAKQAGEHIIKNMVKLGYRSPMTVFSGNGYQLLFACESIRNNDKNKKLFSSALQGLNVLYSNDDIHIDVGVFNPSRLSRLAGTANISSWGGNESIDRKNRYSKVAQYPLQEGALLDFDILEKLADIGNRSCKSNPTIQDDIDICNLLEEKGIKITKKKRLDEGVLYEMEQCPFNPSHIHSSFIIHFDSGKIVARCFHDSCTWKWKELAEKFDIKFPEKVKDKELSMGKKLIIVAKKQARFIVDKKLDYYCLPLEDGMNNRTINMRSSEFSKYLSRLSYEHNDSLIKKEELRTVITQLEFEAEKNPISYEISRRCALEENSIYYDLCNLENEVIKISKDKIEITNDIGFPLFERTQGMMLPQMKPDLTVKTDDLLPLLKQHFIMDENKLFLFSVYLCTLFLNNITSPLCVLTAPPASGKSILLRNVINLVDRKINPLIMFPKGERNFNAVLSQLYIAGFDNCSDTTVSNESSDSLCMAITGVSTSSRALFTDNTIFTQHIKTKLMMNGLSTNIITQEDLISRSILIELEKIPNGLRRTEEELEQAFTKDTPSILGAIFKSLQGALNIIESIKLKKTTRLASFCNWGYAIAEQIKPNGGGEEFMNLLLGNQEILAHNAVESNPVAFCIRTIMEDKDALEVSVDEMYNLVNDTAHEKGINTNDKLFPKANHVFSSRLKQIKPLLEEVCGITYDRRESGRCKMLYFVNHHYERKEVFKTGSSIVKKNRHRKPILIEK